jgi:iron-sulfur cluster repair protein YtfE (RIC family)
MTELVLTVEDSSVDTVMARHPATMEVFNAFGVDTCCGAHSSVREAAVRDGVDEAVLVTALRRAIAESR